MLLNRGTRSNLKQFGCLVTIENLFAILKMALEECDDNEDKINKVIN